MIDYITKQVIENELTSFSFNKHVHDRNDILNFMENIHLNTLLEELSISYMEIGDNDFKIIVNALTERKN